MTAIRQEKLSVLPAALSFIGKHSRIKSPTVYVGRGSERRVYFTLDISRGIAEVFSRSN